MGPKGFWKKNTPIYFQDFMSSKEMQIKYWEQSVNFKSNFSKFLPNKGHEAITSIIQKKANGHCVTQNVDNLHQASGLTDEQVTEIHGNATYAVCLDCNQRFELESIHENFKQKQSFPFELLSDPEEIMCKAFDVMKLKSMYGKEYIGVDRSTFLISSEGKIIKEWRSVKVKGHVDEVLDEVKKL